MKKINEFEKQLIARGLELVIAEVTTEIKVAESEGKRHIFGENFVPMIVKELKEKLKIES